MTVLAAKKVNSSSDVKLGENVIEVLYDKKSSWQVIAKNEIKLKTSHFRNHRKLLFLVLYSFLFSWAFIVAPLLFDLFMPTLAVQYSSIFKPAVAIIIESLMMILFLVLVMYPLNNIYREEEVGAKESLLATPVKAGDIFLGEFLGKAPLYSMAVLILAPIVVGMINPVVDLTIAQYIVVYGSVFVLVYFANLVGSIIASWFEHKISKNEKARDLGKALIWVFTIIMVIIMYAVMFFLNFLLAHPELKNYLAFYPSLWYSNLILYSLDPILLEPFILNLWVNLLLAAGIPLVTLYISYKRADSFYTLEGGIEKSNKSIMKYENIFFRFVRRIFGRWGGLTTMQLKRFFRKKANFARIAYVMGLLGFMSWFMSKMGDDIFGTMFATIIIIAIGGGIGSIMIGHLAFVNSKDLVWVYKRSPRGIKSLVYSYLLAMFVINIFIAMFISVLFSVFMGFDMVRAVIFFMEFLLFTELSMCQASGIQCLNPAYGEKDGSMRGNTMISMVLLQPLMFFPILLISFIKIGSIETILIMIQGLVFLYIAGTSLPLLYFGLRKLNKIE
ncbi:MAG: hypothetical protein ACW986_19295 [Promethearchaeota archaeon]|jgi:hypothetical protein